jgi:serine/threonine protein kinase
LLDRQQFINLTKTARKTNIKKQYGFEFHSKLDSTASPPLNSKRYTIVQLLGQGGTKKVYKAWDHSLQRHVALAAPGSDDSDFHGLQREARLNAQLDHPHIIKIFDIQSSQQPFFTMELKPGCDLKQWLKQHGATTPLHTRLHMALKLSQALSYSHQRGVLHMDIKPSNVQVGDHGELLLCDWGLGQSFRQTLPTSHSQHKDTVDHNVFNDITRTGMIKGTPNYMAPELRTNPDSASERSEVFSIGIVLLDLLTGESNDRKPSRSHLTRRLIRGKISRPYRAIVLKATDSDPTNRYPRVAELIDDLELALAGNSPKAEKPPFYLSLLRCCKRHWKKIVKFLLLLVMIASICTWLLNWAKKMEQHRRKLLDEKELFKEESAVLQKQSQELVHLVNENKISMGFINRASPIYV